MGYDVNMFAFPCLLCYNIKDCGQGIVPETTEKDNKDGAAKKVSVQALKQMHLLFFSVVSDSSV